MTSIIILIFVIGYLSITLEHPLKLDKTVPALIMAALIWALLAIGFHAGWFDVIDTHENVFNFLSGGEKAEHGFENTLLHHLGKTAVFPKWCNKVFSKPCSAFSPPDRKLKTFS